MARVYVDTFTMNLVTLAQTYDDEDPIYTKGDKHGFWPLDQIDPTKSRFPCCLVWTPLPVVSWLAPFIGHVGLCMEDGAVVDFSGSNLVTIDDFAYGSVARYIQLDREQVQLSNFLDNLLILGEDKLNFNVEKYRSQFITQRENCRHIEHILESISILRDLLSKSMFKP